MNLSKLVWSPASETGNASAAVRKLAVPLQKSFATQSSLGSGHWRAGNQEKVCYSVPQGASIIVIAPPLVCLLRF
jgi:hypothetical protein